jgi:hypothetical protein
MSDLPKFPREPISTPEQRRDRQMWRPEWKCFCCEDSGFIASSLMSLIVPDYNSNEDKLPLCQNCSAGSWVQGSSPEVTGTIDWRFKREICVELDRINREGWRITLRNQFEARQQALSEIHDLTQQMNLRTRDRDWREDQKAEHRHQRAIADLHPDVDQDAKEPEEEL